MATISEFQQQISLFVEALDRLTADKSEVVFAQEQLVSAQDKLAKEQSDVTGATETLTTIWTGVKATGDSLVEGLIAP
jgi:hypothetical protein